MEELSTGLFRMKIETPKPYITVSSGMRGFYAVLMCWDKVDQFYEPYNTGIGSYKTKREAVIEAKEWADAEGVEYHE
jgi:hypothetical protein